MEKFTVEEISNYIKSRDSLGDVMYFLSAENIRKANEKPVPDIILDIPKPGFDFSFSKDGVYYDCKNVVGGNPHNYGESSIEVYNGAGELLGEVLGNSLNYSEDDGDDEITEQIRVIEEIIENLEL